LGAKSNSLPKLNAVAGYTHNGSILNVGSSAGLKKDKGIFTGYIDDNTAGLALEQSIFNGGANRTQLSQAKLDLNIQEQTLRLKEQDVAFETKRLYYGALLAKEVERIAQHLLDLAQAHYEDTQHKYEAGVVSRFDVLQSKVQVSKVTPELIRAKNAFELISAELKKMLGLGPEDVIELKDKLVRVAAQVNEREALKVALLNNPGVLLQMMGINMSKLQIDLAKASNRPQINAGVGYSFRSNDPGDMFNSQHENWNAGLSISVPLFDGFSSKAKVDEAKARYSQSLLLKDDFDSQIAVNVKRAVLDLVKAEALIKSQESNIEEAQESLRIAQVRYDNGEGTNLDLLDAQVSLSEVERNYSAGVFDALVGMAYLQRILGMDKSLLTGEYSFLTLL
jgi:outer membrane protein TolC